MSYLSAGGYIRLGGTAYTPRQKTFPSLTISPGLTSLKLRFQGNNFFYKVQGCYLSANTDNEMISAFDFYSGIKSISAKFTAFSGIPIDDYQIIGNNILTINFPQITLSGCNVDFIFTNPAGYAKASNSNRFSYVRILTA